MKLQTAPKQESPEQQSEVLKHAPPEDWQDELEQVPPKQEPLQQSDGKEQKLPEDRQGEPDVQIPAEQESPEQQSEETEHEPPEVEHELPDQLSERIHPASLPEDIDPSLEYVHRTVRVPDP